MSLGSPLRPAHSQVLAQLTRGRVGRATPADLHRLIYRGWLIAFALKAVGSSWDVAWHFKWLRDDFAPPHLLNSAGTVLAMVLIGVHWYTGYGVDRVAKRLLEWGIGIFMVAIPIDLLNHRINGIDITSWSPSHALLYFGTALMIAGVARGWWQSGGGAFMLGVWFLFFAENLYFPNQHQEYGVLELASWDRGEPFAEPSLLRFAADQMGRPVDRTMVAQFSLPVPAWVYPVWAAVGALIVLVVVRNIIGRHWTATAVAGSYVVYRAMMWMLLARTGFPHSAVPFFLIAGAICVDVAFVLIPRRR